MVVVGGGGDEKGPEEGRAKRGLAYLEHEHATSRRVGHAQQLEDQGTRDLVGRIRDTHVVGWEIQLDGVAEQHLELLLVGGAHDALRDLAGHARVELDGDQPLGLLEDAHADVAGSGADLEDSVGGFQVGLVDDGVGDAGVLEDVLADVGVELEDIVLAGGRGVGRALFGGAVIGRGRGRCAFSLGIGLGLGHLERVLRGGWRFGWERCLGRYVSFITWICGWR